MTVIATMDLALGSDGVIYAAEDLGQPGNPESGVTLTSVGSQIDDVTETRLRADGWIIGDKMARPVQAVDKDDITELDPMTDEGDDRELEPIVEDGDGELDPMTDDGVQKAIAAPPETKQVTAKRTK